MRENFNSLLELRPLNLTFVEATHRSCGGVCDETWSYCYAPKEPRKELLGRIRVRKVQASSPESHEPDDGYPRSPPQHFFEKCSTIWGTEFGS